MLNPKWIEGKTIARVDTRPFDDGTGGKNGKSKRYAHAPVIYFTDGSHITFSTEETEIGEYGTCINYWREKPHGHD